MTGFKPRVRCYNFGQSWWYFWEGCGCWRLDTGDHVESWRDLQSQDHWVPFVGF